MFLVRILDTYKERTKENRVLNKTAEITTFGAIAATA